MTTIEIFERGIVRSIPSSWDEMSPEQVRFVIRTYDDCVRRGRSPLEFSVRVLYHLLGMTHNWRSVRWERLYPELVAERDANIFMLCEKCLGFLFSGDDVAQLTFSATANPLPSVRSAFYRRRLIGPADLLRGISPCDNGPECVLQEPEYRRSRRVHRVPVSGPIEKPQSGRSVRPAGKQCDLRPGRSPRRAAPVLAEEPDNALVRGVRQLSANRHRLYQRRRNRYVAALLERGTPTIRCVHLE